MIDCHPQGDADLYGVGVRIGIYAQWLATLLTTLFDPRQESAFRVANLIISASILLGLCIESSSTPNPDPNPNPDNNSSTSNVVGAVITQYLLAGSLSSLTGDGISHTASPTGLARLTFYLALSSYGVWFWFSGVDRLSTPGCQDHEIAFFGHVTVHGRFRDLGKTVSCLGVVLCAGLIGLGAYRLRARFREGLQRGLLAYEQQQQGQRERPRVEVLLLVLSVGVMGCSIYLVEHLIRVNGVRGLNAGKRISVGQLIPLLAGVVACGLTLWNVLIHRLFLRKRCWFLLGKHI